MYTVTFTDKYGNSVSYNALTKEQAEQIAAEYASDYPDSTVTITGSAPPPPSPPQSDEYIVSFKDQEGSVNYHAQTKKQAEQIAKEYTKTYGEQAKITSPTQNIANAPDIRAIADENALNPRYRVIVRDKYGNDIVRTALTYHDALILAKTQTGGDIYILTPQNELEKVVSTDNDDREQAKKIAAKDTVKKSTVKTNDNENSLAAYGAQADIKTLTLTFRESPEMAMYKQIEKEEMARKAAEEAQEAVDDVMSTIPSYALISELNKIGKEIESKAKQLNEAAMKNTNPVVAYAEASSAALLGAAAGVAELPLQTAEFVASAIKNPAKAVKSLLLAPVTTAEEAVTAVETGNVANYGKIIGQTLVTGEIADELGITPSKAIEKIPYSEKVLAPAKDFAERATAKLNDVILKPLTEYKPQRTAIIVDTEDEHPSVTLSKNPEQASIAAIKDIGKIKDIKPVTSVVAETAFNLKTAPVEELAEFKNPIDEGTVKVRGETAEGEAFTKTRLKTGYELQTEKPIRVIRTITEYSNKLGRKAILASEVGEDTVKVLLRKGDEIKGYGIKVVDSYPMLDQESFGGLRAFGEVREVIPEESEESGPVKTIDLRKLNTLDEDVRKAVFGEEEKNYDMREQTYELKEETSHFKMVDVSDEIQSLEKELNEELELPDFSKVFERVVDFGKDVRMVRMGLGFAVTGNAKIEKIVRQKGGSRTYSRNKPDVVPDIIPSTSTKPSVLPSTTPTPAITPATAVSVTPVVTPATTVTPDITPEPKTNAKSKSKPVPPESHFFIPSLGGESFYRILEEEGGRLGKAIKVNPVVTNPLTVMFGGKKRSSKRGRKR